MINLTDIKQLFKRDYSVISFILSFIGFVLSYVFNFNIGLYLSTIVLFASFDSLGYYYILTEYQTIDLNNKYNTNFILSYRILQFIFQLFLAFVLFLKTSLLAYCFIGSWWFGICDWLYYLLLKQNYKSENMFWLKWTIFGIVLTLFKKDISSNYLTWFSILSLISSLILIYTIH